MSFFSTYLKQQRDIPTATTDELRAKSNKISVALSAKAKYDSIVATGVDVTNKIAALKQELVDTGYAELSESLS